MTSKDLDYIKDAFNWNLNVYNTVNMFISKVSKKELKTVLKDILDLSYNNMETLIKYMEAYNG